MVESYNLPEKHVLTKKTALVTGSTKGIGLSIAIDLLEENYKVLLNYAYDDQTASDVYHNLSNKYSKEDFLIFKCDLSDVNNTNLLLNKTETFLGKVDVLVLNAGTTVRKQFESITIEDWHQVMDTNLTSPFFIIQKLLPLMHKGSRILCIGSIMGIYPHSNILYGVSKAGLHYMAKTLVKELIPYGITINVVCPGFVDTPWQENKPECIRKSIESKISLKVFAKPCQISSFCISVLNNEYLNGSILVIDGGYCYE